MPFYCYILECQDGSFYTGWTIDLVKRLQAHNSGRGARYTRSHLPVSLVYYEELDNRADAMRRERELKKKNHNSKQKLINSFNETLESPLLKAIPDASWLVISPGRVNFLGEHVDYNNGVVLPAAINRYVKLAIKPHGDNTVTLHALDLDASVEFSLKDLDHKRDVRGDMLPDWALYPASVAWAYQKEGFTPGGMEAAYMSNLPIGAGLSSSAAVELAFAEYWKTIGAWEINRMRMAEICQYGENTYVGVNCGLMDQFAIAHGVARCALFFDTGSRTWQPIPLPLNTAIVIADSTIRRKLSASDYNLRREECQQALVLIQQQKHNICSLSDVLPKDLEEIEGFLPSVLMKRVQHVVEENERVKQACRCLITDDAPGFGKLMVAGHASLRDLYEVSLPELDALVNIAIQIDGCYGARLTGAGFGGCTVNFVEWDQVENFSNTLIDMYANEYGMTTSTYICSPSRSVHIEQIGE
ncbi:MAG: galactokinase [Pelolinea sp.]|nr:galactokinase [Pelolinea sp.]